MEHLGYIYETPKRTKKGWENIVLDCDDEEIFNETTSKVLRMFKHPDGEGKCVLTDSDGQKYVVDVVHANFDIYSNQITLFPYFCRELNIEKN